MTSFPLAQTSIPDIGLDLDGYVTDIGIQFGIFLVGLIGVGLAIFLAKWGYTAIYTWFYGFSPEDRRELIAEYEEAEERQRRIEAGED